MSDVNPFTALMTPAVMCEYQRIQRISGVNSGRFMSDKSNFEDVDKTIVLNREIQKDCDTIIKVNRARPVDKDKKLYYTVDFQKAMKKVMEPEPKKKIVKTFAHAGYMENYIRVKNLSKHIRRAVKTFKANDWKFDAIAFRGMSGALTAPTLALRLNKELLMVRKDVDNCHSGYMVEGLKSVKRYIIVDDFMASGKTCREIEKEIKKFAPNARCLGLFSMDKMSDDEGYENLAKKNHRFTLKTSYRREDE